MGKVAEKSKELGLRVLIGNEEQREKLEKLRDNGANQLYQESCKEFVEVFGGFSIVKYFMNIKGRLIDGLKVNRS